MEHTIKITEFKTTVCTENNGVTQCKDVSLSDLFLLLGKRDSLQSGLLPPGTRYYASAGEFEGVIIELPPAIRTTEFNNGIMNIPWPGLCIGIDLNLKTKVLGCRVYAIKTPILNTDTTLFKFPYGNVYGNGSVCWGSVRNLVGSISSIAQVGLVINSFILSKFNGDLDAGVIEPFSFNKDTYEIITENKEEQKNAIVVSRGGHLASYLHNSGATEFLNDTLRPTTTVLELIKYINGGKI